jgi:aspartate kinase
VTSRALETVPIVSEAEPRTVVMKFGGALVGDAEQIHNVARSLVAARVGGARVVGVVTAAPQRREELVQLAHRVSFRPDSRELDLLLSVAERISCALVALAINDLGFDAISLAGSQAGIVTDATHGAATIVDVRIRRIEAALDRGRIVLVAASQGVSTGYDITTLGRDGADATAIALAQALRTEVCDVSTATGEVVQLRSATDGHMQSPTISGVTQTLDEAVFRVHGAAPSDLFSALADRDVSVDTIAQTSADVIVFSAPAGERQAIGGALDGLGVSWSEHDDLGKISLVGADLKRNPGIAARTFQALRRLGLQPQFISTSPTRLAFYLPHAEVGRAVKTLNEVFELGEDSEAAGHA